MNLRSEFEHQVEGSTISDRSSSALTSSRLDWTHDYLLSYKSYDQIFFHLDNMKNKFLNLFPTTEVANNMKEIIMETINIRTT